MNSSMSRRSLSKKVGVCYNQKRSSISKIIATGSDKNRIKKLQKNNKSLAAALAEIRLENAEYLKLLKEYANENTQIIKAKNKLKVMAESIQNWMKDLEQVFEILNLKPVDVKKCFSCNTLQYPVKLPDMDPIEENVNSSLSLPKFSISPIVSQENRIPIPRDMDLLAHDNQNIGLMESKNKGAKFKAEKKPKPSSSKQKLPKSKQNSISVQLDTCKIFEPPTTKKEAEEIDCILPDSQLSDSSQEGNNNLSSEPSTKQKSSKEKQKLSKRKELVPKDVLELNEPNVKIRKKTAEEKNLVCIQSTSADSGSVEERQPRRTRTAKSLKEPKINSKMRR